MVIILFQQFVNKENELRLREGPYKQNESSLIIIFGGGGSEIPSVVIGSFLAYVKNARVSLSSLRPCVISEERKDARCKDEKE